jgi:CHAP domain
MPNYRSLVPGGFFSSKPTDRSVPVAIRTNNPGAINTVKWVKEYPGYVDARVTTPGNATAVFETPEHGTALWWQLLHNYRRSLGAASFTLRNVIFTYCGRGRQREAVDYTAFVCAKASVSGNMLLDLADHNGLLPIAKAFFWYEAGRRTPILDEQILHGFDFAQKLVAGVHPQLAPVPRVTTDPAPARRGRTAAAAAPTVGRRTRLASLAEQEASQNLKWTGATSAAEKYLKPLRAPMRALGHIGNEPVFYNWCAAFVTWCARQSGYQIPDQPTGFWATMALVESWKFWGNQQHLLVAPDLGTLVAGDILLYEWFDGDSDLDHIGIFLRAHDGAVKAAEGNATGARSEVATRKISNVKTALRLPV